jgi:hypothetical protein
MAVNFDNLINSRGEQIVVENERLATSGDKL